MPTRVDVTIKVVGAEAKDVAVVRQSDVEAGLQRVVVNAKTSEAAAVKTTLRIRPIGVRSSAVSH